MFSQMYFHKTRQAYDGHVNRAVKEILRTVYPDYGGYYPDLDHIDKYIEFDDWRMCGLLKEGRGGIDGERIINRNHYRYVFATSLIPTDKELEDLEKNRNTVHEKVETTYTIFEAGGEKYVQFDTYGRVGRENPEKISQSFQIDSGTALFLVKLLKDEFEI